MQLMYCRECDQELAKDATDAQCVGCQNEATGKCRWCENKPGESGLCSPCESAGGIASEVGSFGAYAVVVAFREQLEEIPEWPGEAAS